MGKKNYSKVKGVAGRIAQALLESGLSQAEVAGKLQVFPTAVSRWKTGATEPTPSNINALAKVLKVDVNWLMKGGEKKYNTNLGNANAESDQTYGSRKEKAEMYDELMQKYLKVMELNQTLLQERVDYLKSNQEPEKKSRVAGRGKN